MFSLRLHAEYPFFVWKSNSLALMVYVLAALYPRIGSAQTQVTPKFCILENDTVWYFSLDKIVFRVPVFPGFSANVSEQLLPGNRLVPPNALAPIGCRDNPQQISSVWLINWPKLTAQGDPENVPTVLYKLNLRLGFPTDQDSEVGATKSKPCGTASKNFIKVFDSATVYCTNRPEGLNTLSGPPDRSGELYSLFWRFQISKDLYQTADHSALSVFGTVQGGASASYFIAPYVVIDYNWMLPLHKISVDPLYVIKIDKLIEMSLKKYELSCYPWRL